MALYEISAIEKIGTATWYVVEAASEEAAIEKVKGREVAWIEGEALDYDHHELVEITDVEVIG